MNKAVVTGATGFIGRYLVEDLVKNNVEVIAVARKGSKNSTFLESMPVRLVECNNSDYASLPEIIVDRDLDTVFHLAWQGVSDSDARNEQIQLMNLNASLALVDAAKAMGAKTFVGAGSVHEMEALEEMSADKVITNLGFMYKTSKLAAHWMCKAKCGNMGMRFFWPFINTYGERERSARLINTIIRKIFNGESPALSLGEQYYDFVHVQDVASALRCIAERGVDGTNYFIGSGEAKQLKDFLIVVGEVANSLTCDDNIPLGFGEITSNVIYLPKDAFDSTKLFSDTGFKPTIPFREGVTRTARWISNNPL